LKLISSEILGEGTENILLREIKIILLRVKDFFALFMTLRVLSFLYLVWGFSSLFLFFSLRVLIIIYSGCNYISSSDEPFITLFRAGKGPSGLHLEVIFSVLPFL
jgi:hypothetical protein